MIQASSASRNLLRSPGLHVLTASARSMTPGPFASAHNDKAFIADDVPASPVCRPGSRAAARALFTRGRPDELGSRGRGQSWFFFLNITKMIRMNDYDKAPCFLADLGHLPF